LGDPVHSARHFRALAAYDKARPPSFFSPPERYAGVLGIVAVDAPAGSGKKFTTDPKWRGTRGEIFFWAGFQQAVSNPSTVRLGRAAYDLFLVVLI
jgi:hypothetical protein